MDENSIMMYIRSSQEELVASYVATDAVVDVDTMLGKHSVVTCN